MSTLDEKALEAAWHCYLTQNWGDNRTLKDCIQDTIRAYLDALPPAKQFSDEDIESSWTIAGSKIWPGTMFLRKFLEALGAAP